jgi:hypothetical protein
MKSQVGNGHDRIDVSQGNNTIYGGANNDLAVMIRLSSGTVVLISFMVVTGTIRFKLTCSLQSCCQNKRKRTTNGFG